jgi:hypothetical protein
MMVRYYRCEFLSDVILQSSSNTQGNIQLSDFIAGSNFLGMVAANGGYDAFGEDAFDVFHSGVVCFGDGHLLMGDQMSYKIPLSYFNLKIGEGNYNRIHLSAEEEQSLRDEHKQLKQRRTGYMSADAEFCVHPAYRYSQKSAYDRVLRRSKEGEMFGYSALEKGTHWVFKVTYADEKYVEDVEKKLFAATRLGKSKSAEYGQIKITALGNIPEVQSKKPDDGLTYLYANSRLALVDENGAPTLTPSIENLGLKSGSIVWEKTQLKTISYNPYNYTRETKEYLRLALAKGSVIVLKDVEDENIHTKVGAYLNEGFGDILVNPEFLMIKEPRLEKYSMEEEKREVEGYNASIVSFLEKRVAEEKEKFDVAAQVRDVMSSLVGPSRSQWGQIRTFASLAKSKEDLIENITLFIENGVSKKQWRDRKIDSKLIEAINNSSSPLAFTKLLAMMMPKQTQGGKNAN